MTRSGVLLLLVPLLLIVGCGSSDPSPEDEVRDVATRIIKAETAEDVENVCRTLVTPALLEDFYGGKVQACVENPPNDDSDIDDPGEVSVASVTIEGQRANVAIETSGGTTEDNDGTWYFRETDGQWQLNRVGDDFLRSSFKVSLQNVDEGVFGYESMRNCMIGQVTRLDPKELREFVSLAAQDKEEQGKDAAIEIAGKCPQAMAEFVADELASEVLAEQDLAPARIRCVKQKLVPLLRLTDLSSIALGGGNFGDAGAYALAGLISGAMKRCPA